MLTTLQDGGWRHFFLITWVCHESEITVLKVGGIIRPEGSQLLLFILKRKKYCRITAVNSLILFPFFTENNCYI